MSSCYFPIGSERYHPMFLSTSRETGYRFYQKSLARFWDRSHESGHRFAIAQPHVSEVCVAESLINLISAHPFLICSTSASRIIVFPPILSHDILGLGLIRQFKFQYFKVFSSAS